MRRYGAKPWYEGGNDPLDSYSNVDSSTGQVVRSRHGMAVDIGPANEHEPDHEYNPLEPLRKVVAAHVELSAKDPLQIMIECEEQDEMLGLEAGTTMKMFLEAMNATH